jgi:hypothetical protein
LGAAGAWADGAWSQSVATAWDSLLSTGLTTAQAAGDTFYVRMKLRDAAGNESRWYTSDDFPELASYFRRILPPPVISLAAVTCVSGTAFNVMCHSNELAQRAARWKYSTGSFGAWTDWTALGDSVVAVTGHESWATDDSARVQIKAKNADGIESSSLSVLITYDNDAACYPADTTPPVLTLNYCECASDHPQVQVSSDEPAQFCFGTRTATNSACSSGGSWGSYSTWSSGYSTSYQANGPTGSPIHYSCVRVKARDRHGNESTTTLCGKYYDEDGICHD